MSAGEDRPATATNTPAAATRPADESTLLAALRAGDEAAFASLIDRYHAGLVRMALGYVHDRPVAEEVVQETWIGVLDGLDRFEGRSLLKTWIYRILINQAKTRGQREARSVPFSRLTPGDGDADEPAVDPAQFLASGPWTGHWSVEPQAWDADTPERILLTQESREYLEKAIAELPPNQQRVIVLYDLQGFETREICNLLEISETNLRVLLHRARSKVRRALEPYVQGGRPT